MGRIHKYTNPRGKRLQNWLLDQQISARTILYPPAAVTYNSNQSRLDMCLADLRLQLTELVEEKLRVLEYTSDHDAIEIRLNLRNIEGNIELQDPKITKNYKHTRWKKFQKMLANNKINIPIDRNVNNGEVSEFLQLIEKNIKSAIDLHTPDYKHNNSSEKYINKNIKKLQSQKATLISHLKKIYKTHNNNLQCTKMEISKTKDSIEKLDQAISTQFTTEHNKYWQNKAKEIDHKKTDKFFPEIIKMFRSKTFNNVTQLNIETDKKNILDKLEINTTNLIIKNNNYIITDEEDILNIIAQQYQSVNMKKTENQNDPLTGLIQKYYRTLEEKTRNRQETGITITPK